MVLRIGVEQSADHALVLGAMPLGLPFKKIHASLGKRDGDFYSVVTQR